MPLGCLRLGGGGGGGKVLKLLIDWGITLEQSGFKLVWISFFLFFLSESILQECARDHLLQTCTVLCNCFI